MRVSEVTWGDEKQNFVVRFRGQLVGEPGPAYEKLAGALRPLDVTPLFRKESGQHAVVLMRGVLRPRASNPWVNLVLFLLTLVSMPLAYMLFAYSGPATDDFRTILFHMLDNLGGGLAFALSLLAILLAHEFGHYLAARFHHTAVTLPYFIPFPFNPFGTMGAFIQLKEPPKNKRILLDIGIAGPLAGLIVAIPILYFGLRLSNLDQLPLALRPGEGFSLEGNSLLYLIMKYAVFGQLLPHPGSYSGLHPFIYWVRYFFTGMPTPLGGTDVMLHPVAWAGWAGLLVTALNLIPAGQLDGGHVLYVLLGARARSVLPFILVALVALGVVWSGWWLWAFLIFILGRLHAEPLVLVFTPVPLNLIGV
jgi:Zn-dependent protease